MLTGLGPGGTAALPVGSAGQETLGRDEGGGSVGQQGGAGGRTEATAEAPCDNSGHIFDSTDCYGFTVQPQSSPHPGFIHQH